MLYATSSRGVFTYDERRDEVALVVANKHTPGFFRRRARGFFGICLHRRSGLILTASRERLGTRRAGKPTTDAKLHFLEPGTHKHWVAAEVSDVHDVHQIACHEDFVYLTDTGKNRIHVYDLAHKRLSLIVDVGHRREDINHINALLVQGGELLIGLNNRGQKDSEILYLPLERLHADTTFKLDAVSVGRIIPVPGVQHSHDLKIWQGHLLLCASHEGRLHQADGTALAKVGGWLRGLAPFEGGIWVGASEFAPRSRRHSKGIDGRLVCFSAGLQVVKDIRLTGAGQVNDLCFIA